MNSNQLQAAALLLIILGWFGKVVWELLHRDRTAIDKEASEQHRQALALWGKVDEMRQEVEDLRRDLAVMQDRVQALPDFERWDAKLENLRTRLEDKLDKVSGQLGQALVQIAAIDVTGSRT